MKKACVLFLGLFFLEQKVQPVLKTVIKSGAYLVAHSIVAIANYDALMKEKVADPSHCYHINPYSKIDQRIIFNVPALKAFGRACHQIMKKGELDDNVKQQRIVDAIKIAFDSSMQHAGVHAGLGLGFSGIPFFGLVPAAYCAYNAQNLATTTVDCANNPLSLKAVAKRTYLNKERVRVSLDKSLWSDEPPKK